VADLKLGFDAWREHQGTIRGRSGGRVE